MKLSPRLAAIAELVPPGARFCDVASDHAYLPIQLILTGAVRSCIASDISAPCVARAKENAARAGVEDALSIRLSDGLEKISPGECDCISMSGLGGESIMAILDNCSWLPDENHLLILQPASRANLLRRRLYDLGCVIPFETVVRDSGRLYPLFTAVPGTPPPRELRDLYAYASPALLSSSEEPCVRDYILRTADLLSREQGHDPGIVLALRDAVKGADIS